MPNLARCVNKVRFLTRLVHVTSACDQWGWLLGVSGQWIFTAEILPQLCHLPSPALKIPICISVQGRVGCNPLFECECVCV